MRKDHTEIAVVIDRSYSMLGKEPQVCKGFNTFLWQQVCALGTANITVVLFDDKYQVLHSSVPANTVPAITDKEYYVRGDTALFDALGKTVVELEQRIKRMDLLERPEKVIVAITTDGQENCSLEWTESALHKKLDEMRAQGWEFIWLSTTENDRQASSLGYGGKDIAFYEEEEEDGITSSYLDMSTRTLNYRGGSKE